MPNQPKEKAHYYVAERQVHPELKNYYHINHFRGLSDSNFFLLCVDTQTLDLLHSLKEPKYYARWKVEVNNDHDERISTDEDKAFVDYVWGKLEEQLADVACLTELTEVLKELVAIKKMELAAKTDGIIRDHYPDPARLDEFAAKVGLTVADLPTSDNDLSWPELSRFDDLGDNRKMIDEVPSVWISEGMLTSKSMADMYAETQYETPISDPTGLITPIWVGQANSMAKYFQKLDLALRHINAKFSRNGQVQLDLAEEPFTYNILTGDRVSIRSLIRTYLPSLVNLWPIKVYTSGGSVFTWGGLKSDDPQKYDPDMSLPHDSWLNKSLHESMRSMATTETVLLPGLPIVGATPAIPATPISAAIPSVPFFAGTTDVVWPGTYGVGLADMLKLPEKPKSYTAAAMGLPYGVEIVGGKVFAVLPGDIRMQVFPVLLMPKLSKLTGESITSVLDAAFRLVKPTAEQLASTDPDEFTKAQNDQSIWSRISGIFTSSTPNITNINFVDLFNQFFRLADDDPNLKSPDIKTHAQILNNQGFSISGSDFNFNANLTGVEAQLAAIVTKLGGVDRLQIVLEQKIIDLINALEGSLGQSNDSTTIKTALEKIAQAISEIDIINTNILNTGETAYINVGDGCCDPPSGAGAGSGTGSGGYTPPSLDEPLPNEQPVPDSDICDWVDYTLDTIISFLEWILWAVEWGNYFFGETPVGKLIVLLARNKQFIAALVALGLVDPLPDEVVTLPAATVTILSVIIVEAIDLGVQLLKSMLQVVKDNKQFALDLFCNHSFDPADIPDLLDDWIDEIVRQLPTDADRVRKYLKLILKDENIMRKFKYKQVLP